MRPSVTIFSVSLLLVSVAIPAHAEYVFNPHFILSDEEMSDVDTLTIEDIQAFLERQNSGLSRLRLPDYLEVTRRPAEIIWQAAQESRINPKVLLTTLQKEQSLITTAYPSTGALERAMGYRCPDSGSCNPSTLHFGKQVDGAAWQFRQYMDFPTKWTFQMGKTTIVDDVYPVTPGSSATAGFYNYTPHISGNESFWRLWVKFWGKNFPDGTLLKSSVSPAVWYIQNGARRLITSYSVLTSRFDPKKIVVVDAKDVEKYPEGSPLRFSNYSLLLAPDGKVYLLVDDTLRHIDSMETFRKIGFNPEEIEPATFEDLAGYAPGVSITAESVYPTGALLQDSHTGGVYYVVDGEKHPIVSKEILKTNFPGLTIEKQSPDELEAYVSAAPVRFRDGELIKSSDDSKVYVVSGGTRRWIPTGELFTKLGYRWDTIVTTSPAAVAVHPEGLPLE